MEFSEVTKKYWKEEDWKDVEKSESVDDLYVVAERILKRMPKPIVEVCGPLANGGLGSFEANMDVFNETIKKLQSQGLNVFDIMPFEDAIQVLKEKLGLEKLVDDIQNKFYLPIFKSYVSVSYFMSGWETSTGAVWEHQKAKELGMKVVYL